MPPPLPDKLSVFCNKCNGKRR